MRLDGQKTGGNWKGAGADWGINVPTLPTLPGRDWAPGEHYTTGGSARIYIVYTVRGPSDGMATRLIIVIAALTHKLLLVTSYGLPHNSRPPNDVSADLPFFAISS